MMFSTLEEMHTEKSNSATQSDTDGTFFDAFKTEMCAEQGAKRKRQPEGTFVSVFRSIFPTKIYFVRTLC